MESLARFLNTLDSGDLIKAQRGRYGGTWLHPKMGVALARWVDVDFGVWADVQIDALSRSDLSALQRYEQACQQLDDQIAKGSMAGRELGVSWPRTGCKSRCLRREPITGVTNYK